METNVLYYGDNLEILRHRNESGDHDYFPDNSVDLVYLDPPFNSQQSYNVLFKEEDTSWSPAQVKAFEDTWHWGTDTEALYRDLLISAPPKVAKLLDALIGESENPGGIGRNDVTAYLVMMTARLIELHRVLSATGSLYLHCDPTMSHYIKIVLDQIFGPANFRNEIVWRRTASHNQARRYGPIHDIILFYSKSERYFFKVNFRPLLRGHVEQYFRREDKKGRYWTNALTGAGVRRGESGEPWKGFNPTQRNRHWAIPGGLCAELGIPEEWTTQQKLDALLAQGLVELPSAGSKAMPTYKQYLTTSSGIPLQDVWAYQPHTRGVLYETAEGIDEDVRWLTRQGDPERLGYETQKPLGLLQRIITSSCPEKGIVLDPFCGCGTAVVAAHTLNRRWVGIDVTHLAIAVMRHRLHGHFPGIQLKVVGEPVDLPSATKLAKENRYQFQWWALSLIGARPAGEKKKGADKGIDGVIPFTDDGGGKLKRVVVQVKSGHVGVKDIRELRTVAGSDPIGVLLTLEPPTQPMKTEAAEAGFYESPLWQKKFPRVQILTIEEVFAGKRPDIPTPAPLPKADTISNCKQTNLV